MTMDPRPLGAEPAAPARRLYLDQNQWIALARIVHGKDTAPNDRAALATIEAAVSSGRWELPLSAVHYMELSRVANTGRRQRLGAVMHDFSRGRTVAAARWILEHEIEMALARRWPNINVAAFDLVGQGVGFAFGIALPTRWYGPEGPRLERALLAGDPDWQVDSPTFHGTEFRENFQRHLEQMKVTRTLPRSQWPDALAAISMIDILDPLNRVLARQGREFSQVGQMGKSGLQAWLADMPSRRVDMHLHLQVLRDPNYTPKLSDLEDWAALSFATAYCDVVACEKHMAAMLGRDHFYERAQVERSLTDAVRAMEQLDAVADSVRSD